MKVKILEATPDPEEVACRAARNDYMTDWIGNQSFDEVMDNVEGEDLTEKKDSLIEHLMRRGHYGPFEHPHVTFAVEGVSRITMAQITRHRHASFDIQSLRYTKPDLGVTSHPDIETLPSPTDEKRTPGSSLSKNQEETIAGWLEASVSKDVISEMIDVSEGYIDQVTGSVDVDGSDDKESGTEPDQDNRTSYDGEELVPETIEEPGSVESRILGYIAEKARNIDGVLLLCDDVVETEFISDLTRNVGGTAFSPLGEDLYLAIADAPEITEGADSREKDLGFVLGAWEASGGIYRKDGVELAYLSGDLDSLTGYRQLLKEHGIETEIRESGESQWLEGDAEDVVNGLYGKTVSEISGLRKTSLLAAMDASDQVEDAYGDAVAGWLERQQFIYPPSVTQNVTVSRESGRTEYDTPSWMRTLDLMEGYVEQSERYNRLLEQDVPAEDARAVLGMGIKVNMVFTMNARALMHLFDMRAAGDAQWEVRNLSEALIDKTKGWMPNVFEYYDENMKNRKNRLGP